MTYLLVGFGFSAAASLCLSLVTTFFFGDLFYSVYRSQFHHI